MAGHPSIEEIVAGRCDEHLARCDSCRRLAFMADPTAPAGAPRAPDSADDLDRLPPVASDHYTDWSPLADARGGMGRIYRARDRRLGRDVAIKQLADHLGDRERAALVRRFEREARLTARLQHPSIVGIYEAGRFDDGEPFYAMPLLRGAPLSTEIDRRKTLTERLGLLSHVVAVAEAVAYAHDEGIVHRDLKPDNILVGGFGETVLIDWGLAKDLADASGEADDGVYRSAPPRDGLTQLGVGTAHYMPPEQARGEEPDVRADVYALGATLYHALAGAPPYADNRSTQVRLAKFDERPPRPLAEVVPDCPRELCDIVERAMAQDKAVRFASARALAEELRRFQTGQLVTSRRYTFGELVRHFARRHRTALRVSAVAAALVLAIVVVAFVRIARERDRAERAQARAERELRRAQGIVASRTAAEPARRLDSILLGLGAVAPDLAAGRAVAPEAFQGLLDALTVGPPLVQLEHEGVIKGFDHTGTRLLGVDDARALVVWDPASGRRLARWPSSLPQPEKPVASPDGKWAVVCGHDPFGELFDLDTGAARRFDAGNNLEGCDFLPDGRLITVADQVVVRKPDTMEVVEQFALPRPAQGLAIGRTGQVAVTALGGTLWLWSSVGGGPRVVATGLPLGPRSAFSRDERHLYQVGADHVVRTFDVARPAEPPALLHQDTEMQLVAAVPDPQRDSLAVGAFDLDGSRRSVVLHPSEAGRPELPVDGIVQGWHGEARWLVVDRNGPLALVDPRTGDDVLRLTAHSSEAIALPAGTRLVSASRDGAAYLWDLSDGLGSSLMLGHTGEIVALAAHGELLVSAGEDGQVRFWKMVAHDWRASAVGEADRELTAAVWVGDHVVGGDLGGGLHVFTPGGSRSRTATLPAPVSALAAAPAGDRVAVGALDGTLEVREAELGGRIALGDGPLPAVTALAWSPDGERVVSGHVDGSTRLWNADTGQELAIRPDPQPVDYPTDHEGHVTLAFTRDGASVLASRPAGETVVLAAADLSTRATLAGRLLTLSPDGARAVTAAGDGAVLLHPLAGGEPVRLPAARGAALAAAFGPDGALAVAHVDGVVELWDVASRTSLAALTAPGLGPATAVHVEGDHVVVGHATGALRLHPRTPAAARDRACAIAHRFGRHDEVAGYCSDSTTSDFR